MSHAPHVQRLHLMWSQMREAVIAEFAAVKPSPTSHTDILADVEARHVADAYHSLSIEGYRVTTGLIERVRRGDWDAEGPDRSQHDALAAKGYVDAFAQVRQFIQERLQHPSQEMDARILQAAMNQWHLAMFGPAVRAGLVSASELAGWRNTQVFIRGARHVPPSSQAVRDCMPALFELIAHEPHPAVRAVLGHFCFVFIHPYNDGNGRLARFLMNAMLVSGGLVWTVVPVQQRPAYMDALERASSEANITPFARFIARLNREQAENPLSEER